MVDLKELILYTKNLKILFAEDHYEVRKNTSSILENFFSEVVTVDDGQKAYDLYLKDPNYFDIILSDIQMPYIDGIELTKKIYDINPSQSIIILSAYDESKYLLPLVNLGIEQFIKKPINYEHLVDVLFEVSKKISQDEKEEAVNDIKIDEQTIYSRKSKTLTANGEHIYITKFEIILLDLLTDEKQKIYSNDDIVTYFASFSETIDPQNIRKLVSKLRKKLPQESLKSIYGVGYRLLTLS